jgi:hypothetical protein
MGRTLELAIVGACIEEQNLIQGKLVLFFGFFENVSLSLLDSAFLLQEDIFCDLTLWLI